MQSTHASPAPPLQPQVHLNPNPNPAITRAPTSLPTPTPTLTRCTALKAEDRTQSAQATVYALTPQSAWTMLGLLDLHSGARLLYVGCGWGEVLLAWAQAWASASRPEEEAAGEILLDVHAMDIEPSAIAIFREGLAGLAMDGSVRGSVRIVSDTVLIGGALRIVVRARVHLPARRH